LHWRKKLSNYQTHTQVLIYNQLIIKGGRPSRFFARARKNKKQKQK